MKPVLYEKNETQFRTFGLGEIADAYVVEVTRERNGNYTLYIKYPLDGVYATRFQNGMKIKADAGVRTKWQTFEISRVKRNSKEHIEVFAKHISHRTEYLQLNPKVKAGQQTAGMALSLWRSNLVGGAVFDVWSDIEAVADINWEIGAVNNAREALGGVAGSILDLFGGEYEFDNTLIRLHRRLGRQAPIVLEYGRNVVSIEQDDSLEEVYTSIYPYAKYTPQTEGETQADEVLVTLPELVVDGPYLANFDKRRIKLVDFSGQFQDQEVPTVTKLRSLAQSYVISNRIGLAKVAIEVDYVDLAKTLDYKDFAVMEEVELCDVIPLYYPKFGITSSEEKVVEVVYDVLNDENKTIKLGTIGQSISQQLTSSVVERVEHLEKKQASQDQVLSSYLVDGKGNRVWRERPSTDVEHKVGDVWFEKNGIYERMYIWNGNQWEKILDTEDVDRVGKQVATIQAQADQVAAEASQAGQKADQALTKAGASENLARTAKDTADRAILQAGDNLRTAQERANQLASELATTKQSVASQARDILNQAQAQSDLTRKVQTVEETANGTRTTVTELTKTVNANTGNLTSVTQRVATAEEGLTGVRNQYSTLKTTVDDQSGKVTSLERQTADLSSGLDGVKERFENLRVGARNYAEDYDFSRGLWEYHQGDNSPQNWQVSDGVYTVTGTTATWKQYQIHSESGNRLGGKKDSTALLKLEKGKPYTLSFQARCLSGNPEVWISLRENRRASTGGNPERIYGLVRLTAEWKTYQFSTQSLEKSEEFDFWRIILGYNQVGTVAFRKVELVAGSMATDVGPAEEDFRQEFADYKRDASQNLSTLSRIVTSPEGLLKQTESKVNQMADRLEREFSTTLSDSLAGKLRQASAKIEETAEALTSKLSAADLKPFFDKKGIATGANLAETFENWEAKTAQAIEQGLTATRALIPTKVGSQNFVKDFGFAQNHSFSQLVSGWHFERIADSTARSGYYVKATCTKAGGGGFHRPLFDLRGSDWQGKPMTFAVDIKASRAVAMNLGAEALKKGSQPFEVTTSWQRFVQSETVELKTYWSFVWYIQSGSWQVGDVVYLRDPQLEEGTIATTPGPALEDMVTAVDFNKVRETAQLYERVLGRTEGDVATNIARQVMTSELYQTEVRKERDNQANLLTGTEQTWSKTHTLLDHFVVYTLAHLEEEKSFAQLGFQVGDEVTLSFDYQFSQNGTNPLSVRDFRVEGYTTSFKFMIGAVTTTRSGQFRGTFRFATADQLTANNFRVRIDNGNCVMMIKNCRLNRGTVAYPWQANRVDLEATSTRVTQLADSYAIKTLGSAGQVLSAINLATGGASIQVGNNKLVVTPDTTYIQNGTIKSAMIESLDAGKITAGEFDAAKARIINLDVSSVNGLNATFIKGQIENLLVEWLKGKMITASNGASAFDLNNGHILFFNDNARISRQTPGYATQFLNMTNFHYNGDPSKPVAGATLGVNKDRVYDSSTTSFTGLRSFRSVNDRDGINFNQLVGWQSDIVDKGYGTDMVGWRFKTRAQELVLQPLADTNAKRMGSTLYVGDVELYMADGQTVSLATILKAFEAVLRTGYAMPGRGR